MDDRVRLAIGGTAVIAASAALVIAVAASNAAALANQPGTLTGAEAVRVPVGAAPSSTPAPTRSPDPAVVPVDSAASGVASASEGATETVPAPEPVTVVPAPGPAIAEDLQVDEATADAASGDWSAVWDAAIERGWSRERTLAWIEMLKERYAADKPSWDGGWWSGDSGGSTDLKSDSTTQKTTESTGQSAVESQTPTTTEKTTTTQRSVYEPSRQDQSRGTPDRGD